VEESKSGSPVLDREPHPGALPPFDGLERPLLRLYRSRSDRMIGGVAGGLGHYFNVDPVWLRLAFVVLAMSGAGVLAYVILWIVVPERPLSETEPPITATRSINRGTELLAWALVALGLMMLASTLQILPSVDWGRFWPVLLVVAGTALLLHRRVPSA